jgi:hypothetical protein
MKIRTVSILAILSFLFVALPSRAAQDGDETRQIFFDYQKARPKRPANKPKPPAKKQPRYARKTPKPAATPPAGNQYALAGVTLWELRPSSSADNREVRMLVQEEEKPDGEQTSFTPVRVEGNARLTAGDRVRLTIESPRDGYLYVVDRELYADGTTSAPYLIFPTTGTRGGQNRVTAGLLVDIPAIDDRPNHFTLKPGRPDQVGEQLTVVVSPEPLDVPPLKRTAAKLSDEVFAKWKAWETSAERFEMENGAGQTWTVEEKKAAAGGATLLDEDDPLPQTIYRVSIKPNAPLVITVPLTYGATKP